MIYIPAKDDHVDSALAEYINNYPDRKRLRIMFIREQPGVYSFGSKKITIKLEMGKINIRTGGGYISIDEFLDQYTPLELERQKRSDPLLKVDLKKNGQS